MADFETISVKEYFETYLPERFAEAEVQEEGYTLQYMIGDSVYALRVDDRRSLDVIPGGVEAPLMDIRMSEPDWRDSLTGRVTTSAVRAEPGRLSPARVEKLRELRGTFVLELSREGAEAWRSTTIFNGSEAPAVTLRMSAEDYAAMERGEINSQMAFMSGKLKFEGDLGLLMKLSSLLS